MPLGSPRTSHFSQQGTPSELVHMQKDGRPELWEKFLQVDRVVSYFVGSVLFLAGSIFYFPKYSILGNGAGGIFGSWAFLIGCVLFWSCASVDFVLMVHVNEGSILRRVLWAHVALCNYLASCIFVLGALYFLPTWYPKSPELGCWSFFVGSILFCLAALADIGFICYTHADPRITGCSLKNLWCWGTVADVCTFVGAALFTTGSWFYLPKYIAQEDAQKSEDYMYLAITYYTIGSVFFIVSSLAMVPGMRDALNAGKTSAGKDGSDQSCKRCLV